jgi:hypothetical protein
MTTATRKYYAMIPAAFSYNGKPCWLEIHDAKTLTSARIYVDRFLGGITEAEIWMSRNGGNKRLISRKSNGKWTVVCGSKRDDTNNPYANDQIQYHRNGPVSEEEFYAGFQQHEKQTAASHNTNIDKYQTFD